MKYLKPFNENKEIEDFYPNSSSDPYQGKWMSTNPVRFIEKDDITDMMTEITDNFNCIEYQIKNSKVVQSKSLIRRTVFVRYLFEEFPQEKLEYLKKCIDLVEVRLRAFLGESPEIVSNRNAIYMRFYDCRVERDVDVDT